MSEEEYCMVWGCTLRKNHPTVGDGSRPEEHLAWDYLRLMELLEESENMDKKSRRRLTRSHKLKARAIIRAKRLAEKIARRKKPRW